MDKILLNIAIQLKTRSFIHNTKKNAGGIVRVDVIHKRNHKVWY